MYILYGKLIEANKIVGYRLKNIDTNAFVDIPISKASIYLNKIAHAKIVGGYLRNVNGKATDLLEIQLNKKKKIASYIKWIDTTIAEVYTDNTVKFHAWKPVDAVKIIGNKSKWTESEYLSFLSDRILSKDRRDVENILSRMGLKYYDSVKIAEQTNALNPKDMLWITKNEETRMSEALSGTFKNIFKQNIDTEGHSYHTPDGQNIKSYGISRNSYGIFKRRLMGVSTDAESEVAAYKLGNLLGVHVCPAWFVDEDTIFSKFEYDFSREYVVHARRYIDNLNGDLYNILINTFPNMRDSIDKMCLFDFITRQDDRHLSNIAILIKQNDYVFYPLYDNGRSLFYGDSANTVKLAVSGPIEDWCTSFGNIGTYYDVVYQICKSRDISKLINININEGDITKILIESGFTDYRLDGGTRWIMKAINVLKELNNRKG